MKRAGSIVLVPFPFSDQSGTKLRPVLILRRASSRFEDWLVCMVSSRIQHAEADLDEVISSADKEFAATGLKAASVFRLSRLAVVDDSLIAGVLGEIEPPRLEAMCRRLAAWLTATP